MSKHNNTTNPCIIYDCETYPNLFSIVLYSIARDKFITLEISPRRNDFKRICNAVRAMREDGKFMVGFNNFGFDYPVIHELFKLEQTNPEADWKQCCGVVMRKVNMIISASHDERFANIIWEGEHHCPQIDLFKIHHFDNVARATSLKVLEFNMRSESIIELPFAPGTMLDHDQIETVLEYNKYDVIQTAKFYEHTREAIALREQLSAKYERNFLNANDTKIGKTIFQIELEKSLGPDCCFIQTPDGRKPRQTKRKQIKLNDVIFWYCNFSRPEFNAVLDWLVGQTITETKSVFTGLDADQLGTLAEYTDLATSKKKDWGPEPMVRNLNCIVDGFKYVFGTGGLHGCIPPQTVESTADRVIVDLDVVSYYPSLAISNTVFPEHLGVEFCEVYNRLKKQRTGHAKGTAENAALKLALNGVYGDSNNKYSPFYDPQYTMAITINGQLLLCLLADWLLDIESLEMVQVNTDGVTIYVDREDLPTVVSVCKNWEALTDLELESVEYSKMHIRDVNNYVAEYAAGGVKRKGVYEYDIGWNQNHSALVVPKAVEAFLLHGTPVEKFITEHKDENDFYLRTKVPKSSRLIARTPEGHQGQIQNVSRYFISTAGVELIKEMPPLPKAPDKVREIAINKGFLVTVHNELAPIERINFDWYIDQAQRLLAPLLSTK